MNFVVIVTCAIGVSCPIHGEYKASFTAANADACRAQIGHLISQFGGYSPKQFKIVCKQQ